MRKVLSTALFAVVVGVVPLLATVSPAAADTPAAPVAVDDHHVIVRGSDATVNVLDNDVLVPGGSDATATPIAFTGDFLVERFRPDGSVVVIDILGDSQVFTITYVVQQQVEGQTVSSAPATLTFEVIERPASRLDVDPVLLRLSPFGFGLGRASAHLTGLGPSPYDGPLSGRTIAFTAGGRSLCTGVTDATGSASCPLDARGLLAAAIAGGVTAGFPGDRLFQASTGQAGLIG